MQTLTQQWYNALVAGLQLSPENFQLYQGTTTTGPTSEWIWNILDEIPPKSVNNYFNPDTHANFSQDYAAVIGRLKLSGSQDFQNCMGDYYNDWLDYLKSDKVPDNITEDPDVMTKTFNKWAFANAPDQAGCATYLIQSFFNDVVEIANVMFAKARKAEKGYAYNVTIEQLQNDLNQSPARSFSLNSKTAKSTVDHTWAKASLAAAYDFFSFGGSSSYDRLTTTLTTAGLQIDAKFDHAVTVPGGPLAKVSTDPILQRYIPWYDSAAFSRAYATKDNTVWKVGKPDWESTFGPKGNMQRVATALVVVDGINVTITSTATYSKSDQKTITAAAKGGFWPFFSASVSGGNTTAVSFSDSGSMTVKITSPAGNPQLIGVLVTPVSDFAS